MLHPIEKWLTSVLTSSIRPVRMWFRNFGKEDTGGAITAYINRSFGILATILGVILAAESATVVKLLFF